MALTKKPTLIENAAGVVPVTMMFFMLSTMLVLDATRDVPVLNGPAYIGWLNDNAVILRVVLPAVFLVQFVFAALFIVKNWRAFAIYPEAIEDKVDLIATLVWPTALLYMTYGASMFGYAHYVWLHEACVPHDTIQAVTNGARCVVDAARFSPTIEFAGDQFIRGLFGDFFELIGPIDPAHQVQKDTTFILVTGFFRLFAQTALFAIPLSFITSVGAFLRRLRHFLANVRTEASR